MRYDNPQLQEILAVDYVIGTLRGPARQRLESLMHYRPEFKRRVWGIEETLNPLATSLPPVVPPARVWDGISNTLFAKSKPAARPWAWQALAASLAVVSLALALLLNTQPDAPLPASQDYVSIVANADGQPLWLVTTDTDGALRIKPVNAEAPPIGKSFELWLLPEGGAAPISLGLLPIDGDSERALPASAGTRLASAAGIAVSLEPEGGSPTGAPTGPVLYVASLLST